MCFISSYFIKIKNKIVYSSKTDSHEGGNIADELHAINVL